MPMKVNKIKSRWLQAAWLLPMAWLVSCSADNGAAPADKAGARPIVFSVSTDIQPVTTRGVPLNELDGEFGLFCSQYTKSPGWGTGQPLNFMYNEMVIGSGNAWTTAEGYFVPASTYNLKFFAYYPYYEDVNNGGSPIVMGDRENVAFARQFTYTLPQNAEDQKDLMYAISDEVSANSNGELGTVHMNFHHLLTAITIAAKGTDGGTIRRITLKGLYSKGDFDYDAENPVLRAERDGDNLINAYADVNMKLTSTYQTAGEGLSFMIILQPVTEGENPQPNLYNSAQMEVTFDANDGKTYTFTKSLSDLATALTTSRHTLLQLSVESFQKIQVKATITDWNHGANFDGAVSDQPQIELEPLISDWSATDDNDNSTTTNITTGPNPTVTGYAAPTPEP